MCMTKTKGLLGPCLYSIFYLVIKQMFLSKATNRDYIIFLFPPPFLSLSSLSHPPPLTLSPSSSFSISSNESGILHYRCLQVDCVHWGGTQSHTLPCLDYFLWQIFSSCLKCFLHFSLLCLQFLLHLLLLSLSIYVVLVGIMETKYGPISSSGNPQHGMRT